MGTRLGFSLIDGARYPSTTVRAMRDELPTSAPRGALHGLMVVLPISVTFQAVIIAVLLRACA
jgi:hypothetical protein